VKKTSSKMGVITAGLADKKGEKDKLPKEESVKLKNREEGEKGFGIMGLRGTVRGEWAGPRNKKRKNLSTLGAIGEKRISQGSSRHSNITHR